jgi:Flp pilus assembly protein TadG
MSTCNGLRGHGSRSRQRRVRDDRGAGAVEFIVVMPVLMLIFLLLVQWAVQLHSDRIVHAAAREGAVDAASWDGGAAAGRVTAQEYLADVEADLSNTAVDVDLSATSATVTVSGDVLTLLPGVHLRVSATASVPIERFSPPSRKFTNTEGVGGEN